MATKSDKLGFGSRFMHWYESYQGKNVVNIIYSAGASVVIIGALFKILHWPGASQVLMIGMFTEAFLFLIGTLERPHAEFHWENVFPQLLEYGTEPELLEEKANQPRPTLLGAGVAGQEQAVINTNVPASGNNINVSVPKTPSLKEEDFKALKSGIEDLAKTASQLSELGKVAQTGIKLNEKLTAAENATDSYTAATQALSQTYSQVTGEMQQVAEHTHAYKQGVEQVGKNITSLNSVYELQLQTLNEQVAAYKEVSKFTQETAASVKNTAAAAKEAEEAQKAYTLGTKQLEKQVAELNAVYGNMLNAIA